MRVRVHARALALARARRAVQRWLGALLAAAHSHRRSAGSGSRSAARPPVSRPPSLVSLRLASRFLSRLCVSPLVSRLSVSRPLFRLSVSRPPVSRPPSLTVAGPSLSVAHRCPPRH